MVVAEIWLFTIFILALLITTLPSLRDIIYHKIGIYGGLLFQTPANFLFFHEIFGVILVIIGLIHIAIHSGDRKKDLLIMRPVSDFKSFLHSFFYLIGFAKREENSGGEKYTARQRVVYLALVYTFGLSAISGIMLMFFSLPDFFMSIFRLTHIIAAVFIVLILLFHFLITLRRHDSTALKCSYSTGKLPLWHVRKNHKIWYKSIMKHERKLVLHNIKHQSIKKTSDPLANVFIKIYAMDGIILPPELAEEYAENFKESYKPKEIKRFVEISNMI